MISVGTPIKVSVTFTNESNVPVDPDDVTFYVRVGTADPVEIDTTRISAGHYQGTYTPVTSGVHAFQAHGEGVAHSEVVKVLIAPDIAE